MEYTQWVLEAIRNYCNSVLILVVMEYTQWETSSSFDGKKRAVLILVVMEYTQWVQQMYWKEDE